MKKLILLLFICVSFNKLIVAQQYFPFPDSNAVWKVAEAECCPIYEIDNYQIVFKRDTVIHGKQFHIIGRSDTKTDYAIREDSSKKVWVIYLDHLINYNYPIQQFPCGFDSIFNLGNDSTEYLLYDFNLNVNDTVTIFYPKCNTNPEIGAPNYKLVVLWIDSIQVQNNCRKLFNLKEIDETLPPFEIDYRWVEGVGASCGPIYTETTPFFEHGWSMYQFNQNGETLLYYPYYNPGECTVKVPEINLNEMAILLSPNPVKEISELKLNVDISECSQIEIFNSYGNLVKSFKTYENIIKIKKIDFCSGIFVIRVITWNRIYYIKMIVE